MSSYIHHVQGLACRDCGRNYPLENLTVCEHCFGRLEPRYNYGAIRRYLSRGLIYSRPQNIWRYRELLPLTGLPQVGQSNGFTPLVRARRLAERLGVSELYIKNDAVNAPTLSYKDRVVPVAISRALETGLELFACASTGNLANSVAAHAAQAGLPCIVFIPDNLEAAKIVNSLVYGPTVVAVKGNYDAVNRLCAELTARHPSWGIANVNLRPYYAEGAKTMAFEIAEQLGWRFPRHVVLPVAGGTLLPRVHRGFDEFVKVGLVEGELPRIHAAQPEGCCPVVDAFLHRRDRIVPQKPNTIAKSLAIGDPADGYTVLESLKATGGSAVAVPDEEIIGAIKLLAETEGIFAETAGGATLAGAVRLSESGVIPRHESIVVAVTGNGLKTQAALDGALAQPVRVEARVEHFEAAWQELQKEAIAA
ncbi:threonine synthase [bacterium]|nr:threonine synthase [bacterium]